MHDLQLTFSWKVLAQSFCWNYSTLMSHDKWLSIFSFSPPTPGFSRLSFSARQNYPRLILQWKQNCLKNFPLYCPHIKCKPGITAGLKIFSMNNLQALCMNTGYFGLEMREGQCQSLGKGTRGRSEVPYKPRGEEKKNLKKHYFTRTIHTFPPKSSHIAGQEIECEMWKISEYTQ